MHKLRRPHWREQHKRPWHRVWVAMLWHPPRIFSTPVDDTRPRLASLLSAQACFSHHQISTWACAGRTAVDIRQPWLRQSTLILHRRPRHKQSSQGLAEIDRLLLPETTPADQLPERAGPAVRTALSLSTMLILIGLLHQHRMPGKKPRMIDRLDLAPRVHLSSNDARITLSTRPGRGAISRCSSDGRERFSFSPTDINASPECMERHHRSRSRRPSAALP